MPAVQEIVPRYEFRVFAQNFGLVEDKLRHLARFERYRESVEFYLLSRAGGGDNTKIRDEKLDIKTLLRVERELEQWTVRLKTEFPLAPAGVTELFAILDVPAPELRRDQYSLARFIEELARPHAGLAVARVFKRRYGYKIGNCTAELADLLVNGAAIRTVAVESEDPDAVIETRTKLGLREYQNVSYPLALKRITGLQPPAD